MSAAIKKTMTFKATAAALPKGYLSAPRAKPNQPPLSAEARSMSPSTESTRRTAPRSAMPGTGRRSRLMKSGEREEHRDAEERDGPDASAGIRMQTVPGIRILRSSSAVVLLGHDPYIFVYLSLNFNSDKNCIEKERFGGINRI